MVMRLDSELTASVAGMPSRYVGGMGRRSVEMPAGQVAARPADLRRRQHGAAMDERVAVPAGGSADAMTDCEYNSSHPSVFRRRREARKREQVQRDRLVGKRFGMLVVLRRYAGEYWDCRCDCGRETTVLGYNLALGRTKSCWHHKFSPEHRAKLSAAKIGNQNARRLRQKPET